MEVPTMAELTAKGLQPDILFWVGCAGSYDDRAKKITRAFVKILQHAQVNFAVLGTEESCTGDPAKRAGNEMLFQMQALTNIEIMNAYEVKKIVTTCPHCFNIIKNEYPQLGGNYEVIHHTQLIDTLIQEGKLKIEGGSFKGKRLTYHDPCYLGRANGVYEVPRYVLQKLESDLQDVEQSKAKATCCGAGGAQMFKEAEKGNREVFEKRTDELMAQKPQVIATACAYCNTMLTDGIKGLNKENEIEVLDVAELIAKDL
jgi:heterodisulfide reductase subunit D